jgi:hypothetical protein
MDSLSVLTAIELEQLRNLAAKYESLRAGKNYAEADQVRAELIDRGAWPIEHGWNAVFESPERRMQRIAARQASSALSA